MGYKFLFYMIFVYLFGPAFITIYNSQYEYIPSQEIYYQGITENFYMHGKIYENGKEIKVEILDKTVIKDDFDQDTGIHELTLEVIFKRKIVDGFYLKCKIYGKINVCYYDTKEVSVDLFSEKKYDKYNIAFGVKNKYFIMEKNLITVYNLDNNEYKTIEIKGNYLSHYLKDNVLYLNVQEKYLLSHIYALNLETLEIESDTEMVWDIISFAIDNRNNLICIQEVNYYGIPKSVVYCYDLKTKERQFICDKADNATIVYDDETDSFLIIQVNQLLNDYSYNKNIDSYLLNKKFTEKECYLTKEGLYLSSPSAINKNEFIYDFEYYVYSKGEIKIKEFPFFRTDEVDSNYRFVCYTDTNIYSCYELDSRLYLDVYYNQTKLFKSYYIEFDNFINYSTTYIYNNQVYYINIDNQIVVGTLI